MLSCIRLPCMCVSVCVWWVGGGQPCTDHVRITFGSRSDHASDHRFPEFRFKISFYFIHVRLLVDIQFRSATVHSSVTQPEPASLGSVLPRRAVYPTSPRTKMCTRLKLRGTGAPAGDVPKIAWTLFINCPKLKAVFFADLHLPAAFYRRMSLIANVVSKRDLRAEIETSRTS